MKYGPLWSDEGVYRIAKEIQLQQPEKFDSIFLGIGGLHLEKIVITCCGKYLEESGIESVLVETAKYGISVVNFAMNGSNYICEKRGMSLIVEALEHLQLSAFTESNSLNFEDVSKILDTMQSLLNTTATNENEQINDVWERCGSEISKFKEAFEEFRQNSCEISKQFCYWDRFINEIASVLRDLTEISHDLFVKETGSFI